MNNRNIKPISPFILFCQKVIPLAFDESMSYYECLCALVNYLYNEVVPAVNNNADAVTELQNYVKNYFDNLDVQDEINNKLDEMAESGQLADIVAQYLQLAGVLGYNTVNDMINASNLVNGSFARTYGLNTYNDGKGAFYKIRTLTSSDVVDGVNIIAVNFSDTLIAEKMPDYYTNKNETDINDINNNINNKEKGLIAISRNTTNNDHYVYYSEDGINFNRVGNKLSLTEDASALILIGDTYYYFGNNSYYYSTDLVTWSNGTMINDTSGRQNWAFYPFHDPVSDKYFVFSALQYNDDTFTDSVGNTANYFKIIKQEFIINDDKTLTFTTPTDFIYANNESYIDPAICYDDIHKYTIAVKKENGTTGVISIYNTNDLSNIGSPYATLDGVGSEACQLIDEDGFITLYVHDYALNSPVVTGLSEDLGQTYSRVILATPLYTFDSYSISRECCKMPEIFRHAGIMKCDRKTLNLITSIGIKTTPLFVTDDYTLNDGELKQVFCTTANASYTLHNLPYAMYILGGGSSVGQITLNIKKVYVHSLNLFLGPTNVSFTGDTVVHTVTTDATVDGLCSSQKPGMAKLINTPYKW